MHFCVAVLQFIQRFVRYFFEPKQVLSPWRSKTQFALDLHERVVSSETDFLDCIHVCNRRNLPILEIENSHPL